jgi:flagellin
VRDALGLGAATVDVAYTGLTSAIEVVDEIKTKLVAAVQPGIDRAKIQSEITELQAQLQGISDAATFQGQNWLSVDASAATYNATKSIVSSFTRDSAGAVSVDTIDIDITATELYDADDQSGIIDQDRTVNATTFKVSTIDISALTDAAADIQEIEDYVTGVDAAIDEMTDAATTLGAAKSRIGIQQDFVKGLMDAIDRGVGQLVDADMNEESTRLQALQVKQQLGIQALSIANSSSQSILSLFR